MKKQIFLVLGITIMASILLTACGHDHEYGEWIVSTPATCTEDGVEERTCTKCDDTETRAISATGHEFGDWEVVVEATYSEEGRQERTCINCGEIETESIPVIEENIYQLGDTVSTNNMECTLLSVENSNSYITVTYSLRNIGKESLSDAWIHTNTSVTRKCAGLTMLNYNDGYIYDEQVINTIDNATLIDLKPLADAITVTDTYSVPAEVCTNTDAPLLITIFLYSSDINEKAEYNENWADMTNDAEQHTFQFVYRVR